MGFFDFLFGGDDDDAWTKDWINLWAADDRSGVKESIRNSGGRLVAVDRIDLGGDNKNGRIRIHEVSRSGALLSHEVPPERDQVASPEISATLAEGPPFGFRAYGDAEVYLRINYRSGRAPRFMSAPLFHTIELRDIRRMELVILAPIAQFRDTKYKFAFNARCTFSVPKDSTYEFAANPEFGLTALY